MKPTKLKYKLDGSEYSSKIKSHGILNEDHKITTTWILNKNLDKLGFKSLVNEITIYCGEHNLEIKENPDRHLSVTGTSKNFEKAFNVKMELFLNNDHVYHASSEPIQFPVTWRGKIENILGLNTNKVSHFYAKKDSASRAASTTFNPLQLATLYNFPTNLNGTGQKIGIIELGGGYVVSDVSRYFSNLGISNTPNIVSVSVDSAVNDPSDTSGANVEVILDIEVVATIVLGCSRKSMEF